MGLITDIIRDKVERSHADEEKRKAALRAFQLENIHKRAANQQATGQENDPVLDQLTTDYLKGLSPQAKQQAQKGFDLVGKLRSAFLGGPKKSQEGQSQQAAQPIQAPQTGYSPDDPGSPDEQAQQFNAGPQQAKAGPHTQFNTPLNPQEEQSFQAWKAQYAPKDSGADYDLRGAYKAGLTPDPQTGHWPDTYKKPNHPTFSNQSQYAQYAPGQAGTWNGDTFVPPAGRAKQQFNQGPQTQPSQYFQGYGQIADQSQAHKLALETEERKHYTEEGKSLGLTGTPLAEYAATKGQKWASSARPIVGTRKSVQFKLPDESTLNLQQDSRTGQYFDLQGKTVELPDDATPVVTTKAGYIRSVPHSVGLADAISQESNGVEYKDIEGKKLDLSKLPKDMGLQAMVQGDKMFWVPVTPSQKTVVVGNQVYGVNPYQVQSIGTPAVPALGVSRTGSSSTPTQVFMDTAGVPHVLGATTTPNTPGARPQGAAPVRAPIGGAAPATAPTKPVAAPVSGVPGQMQGVPLTAYTRQMQDVRPVRVGVAQLFGDPSNPNFKGLKDYAKLADDKAAQQRIGTAFNLIMKGIESNEGGRVHAGAGGVGADTAGLVNLLENWAGVPNSLAKSEQEQYQQVYSKMTPLEREALNATFESLSTAVGARKLTGASPAQFATQALERDVPIIGRSVYSSDEFYDKLSRFAEMIKNGAAGTFPQVWQPGELQRINQLPSEMQGLKKKGPVKAPAGKNDLKGKSTEDLLKMLK